MPKPRRASQGATLTPVAIPAAPGGTPQAPLGVPDPSSAWRVAIDVKQDAPGNHKTWYSHPEADLFIWQLPDGTVSAFQFCFDKLGKEQLVAWDRERPLAAGQVDSGEDTPMHNRSPVMREADAGTARAPQAWKALKEGLPPMVITVVEDALGWK